MARETESFGEPGEGAEEGGRRSVLALLPRGGQGKLLSRYQPLLSSPSWFAFGSAVR